MLDILNHTTEGKLLYVPENMLKVYKNLFHSYARHYDTCKVNSIYCLSPGDNDCDCGLSETLKQFKHDIDWVLINNQ